MEKVRSLVPVNPHAPEIVAKKVVERISRKEAQAIRYPISFVGDIVIVRLRLSSKFADSLCTPLICTGPNTERDAVQGMLRILLKDERMVQALWLASAGDKLDVMWKASLANVQHNFMGVFETKSQHKERSGVSGVRTLIAACSDLAISLSWSIRGLLPNISGNPNCPTAPFIC